MHPLMPRAESEVVNKVASFMRPFDPESRDRARRCVLAENPRYVIRELRVMRTIKQNYC